MAPPVNMGSSMGEYEHAATRGRSAHSDVGSFGSSAPSPHDDRFALRAELDLPPARPRERASLVGVLARVFPTSANTINPTPKPCITWLISTANTQARAVLAVLARVFARVLALGAAHDRARALAARRRTAMRLAMRPAPAAAARPDTPPPP
eukprot:7380381-Prymnesium_polylepis.1